jgi:nitrite reductase/ring-hydroxylating ferredoxin subunit
VTPFSAVLDGETVEGFVVRHEGRYFAYLNECRHLPLSLDGGSGHFLAEDRRHLLCVHHGALYRPEDGLCVRGPCVGAKLMALTVVEDRDRLWVYR